MPSYILNYPIFFSLNQVLLTALDTFFFGDQAPHPSSGFFATSLSLRPET